MLQLKGDLKVLHIQREVPHYKKGFFEALSSSEGFCLEMLPCPRRQVDASSGVFGLH